MLDHELLARLARLEDEWTLVTGDDRMPFAHADVVSKLKSTIATVDGEWEKYCRSRGLGLSQEQFKQETVHRWAHVMADQSEGEVHRYSPSRNRIWTPRQKYGSLT